MNTNGKFFVDKLVTIKLTDDWERLVPKRARKEYSVFLDIGDNVEISFIKSKNPQGWDTIEGDIERYYNNEQDKFEQYLMGY